MIIKVCEILHFEVLLKNILLLSVVYFAQLQGACEEDVGDVPFVDEVEIHNN
jgi:hypothetical protein